MLYAFTGYSTFLALYTALLQHAVSIAIVASLAISLDRIWKTLSWLKLAWVTWWTGRTPEQAYSCRPLPDLKLGSLYPRVAVQLPMFNELAVACAAIDSACELVWPRSRFIVQVRPRLRAHSAWRADRPAIGQVPHSARNPHRAQDALLRAGRAWQRAGGCHRRPCGPGSWRLPGISAER